MTGGAGMWEVALDPLPPALAAHTTIRGYLLEYHGSPRLAFNPDEAAELLGYTARQVRDLCKTGQLHARVTYPGSSNARYLISARALIEFAEARETTEVTEARAG